MWPFFISRSADLLTVVSNGIDRAFNSSWATRVVALEISKAFDSVRHADLLEKPKFMGFRTDIWPYFFISQ